MKARVYYHQGVVFIISDDSQLPNRIEIFQMFGTARNVTWLPTDNEDNQFCFSVFITTSPRSFHQAHGTLIYE